MKLPGFSKKVTTKALALITIVFLVWPLALGQTRPTGRIVGLVQDPEGAIVPGADVKLEDEATGVAQTAKSGSDGKFVFLNLLVGTYKITVTMQGFRTAVYPGIKVDAGRTTDVTVMLQLGEISETVQVIGGAEVLEKTSTTIETTVRGELIRRLPLNNRDTLDFVLLMPGAQQGGTARQSTFLGLPKGAINITMDGVNVQDNLLKSSFGGGMFTIVRPRLDAVEEVTVKTAGLGADVAGEGAIQIQFVTRRGTNDLHGTLFWDHRNDALNANTWFNNALKLPRPRNLLNVFGGSIGGPISKEKLFFFFNYEEFRLPESRPRENLILTPEAASGIFRYAGTDGVVRTANLLEIARRAGFPNTIDPTVADMLAKIESVRSRGAITPFDLFRSRYRFQAPSKQIRRFPVARLDYHITNNLRWHAIWHYNYFSSFPDTLNSMDPTFPGLTEPGKPGGQYSNRFSVTTALNWQMTSTITNEFRFGVQGAPVQFFPESGPDVYPSRLRILWPLGLQSLHARPGLAGTSRALPSSRNTPIYSVQDTVSMLRGKHTFTFGGNITALRFLDNSFGGAGIPTVAFGVASGDPVAGIFNATSMPGISSTDLPLARALYALLTGRVSSISGSRNVNENSKQYVNLAPLVQRAAQNEFGIFFTDSWRIRPTLTLNYGLRWEFQGAAYNTNGIYTSPSLADLWGPSGIGNVFQPGKLTGVADPKIDLRPKKVYDRDFVNPAPSIGLAWNPKFKNSLLKSLFGEEKTVLRAGYSIAYTREGLAHFTTFAGGNPGLTQSITLISGRDFAPGSLLLRNPLPAFREFPASFSFPISQTAFTFSGISLFAYNPNIKTPYVQSWSFGIQRELTRNMAIEVRYVGNRGTKLWRGFNINEVNIFENGFLEEFKRAQRNLAINLAAGVNSFANRGLPGQSPLPIFEAAFGARGGQPALPASSGFANGTFITLLQQGQAGALAASLAGTGIYLCRMVGNQLPACANSGFNAAGPFPINFFQANPFLAGAGAFMLSNAAFSTYHGLQVQLRRRMAQGLELDAHYTWSKSLTDLYADSATSTVSFTTLRNGRLDKGPSPWDIRHTFVANWTYELPFGPGRRWSTGNSVVNKVIEGWNLVGILRIQSGRVFKLTSGRATVNQSDSGVILKGMSIQELQRRIRIRKDPRFTDVFFTSADLIGPDGRSNRAILDVPTTPGEFGSFIYLYGPNFVKPDLSLIKRTRVNERVNVEFWAEFFNAFNYQNFLIGGPNAAAVTANIDSTSFGRTTDFFNDLGNQDPGPRMIQFRLRINF
jgi:hypothetical protein